MTGETKNTGLAKTFDIGVDLDGVGYNLQAALAPYARENGYPLASEERWNTINPETGTHGGFESWGVPDYEAFLALCDAAVQAGKLYGSGTPFPGFLKMMASLSDAGHRLHIITARTKDPYGPVATATRSWIAHWDVPHRSLSFEANKASRPMDYFIEDSTYNYEALLDAGVAVPYLITRPWNQAVEVENRVHDLEVFAAEVLGAAQGS